MPHAVSDRATTSQGRDYLGLGCGAYGTLSSESGSATRYRNRTQPDAYMTGALGSEPPTASEEALDAATRLRERIMLGIRMRDGFDLEAAAADLGADPYPGERRAALGNLLARGRIAREGTRLYVPRESWIWVDDTAATLF
jgi:coproporphyrinogen III oxidase-like Fe-S oxidoreductase